MPAVDFSRLLNTARQVASKQYASTATTAPKGPSVYDRLTKGERISDGEVASLGEFDKALVKGSTFSVSGGESGYSYDVVKLSKKQADQIAQDYFTSGGRDKKLFEYDKTFAAADKLQKQLEEQGKLYGVKWDNKAANATHHTSKLAHMLAANGVTDVRSLRGSGGNVVTDTLTGKKIEISKKTDFSSRTGKGFTTYGVQFDQKGRPVFGPQWEDSSDAGKIATVAGIGLSLFAPGVGTALGNAMGLSGGLATVAGGAAVNAGLAGVAGARGKDLLKAGAVGAVGGAIPQIPGFAKLNPALQRMLVGAGRGAVSGGSQGALQGALSGAVTPVRITGNAGLDRMLSSMLGNSIRQQIIRQQSPRRG